MCVAKLKHLLKFLRWTLSWTFEVSPRTAISKALMEIQAYYDSDWADCSKTRKSTTGFVIFLLGCAIHFGSKTQSTHALSSGEAELYAMGSTVAEALHVRSFLLESRLCKDAKVKVFTDSTAAKSMAVRFGITRKTRHLQPRFLNLSLIHI